MISAAGCHLISSSFETRFQRNYLSEALDLRRLYENVKRDQWKVSRDIDWKMPVDLERGIVADELIDAYGTEYWTRLEARRHPGLAEAAS